MTRSEVALSEQTPDARRRRPPSKTKIGPTNSRTQPIWLRLQPKINFTAPNGCWEWTAARTGGYGATSVGSDKWLAHRLVYVLLVGEIPAGLTLDHLCENKLCCNPMHLDPCTLGENTLRSDRAPATKHAKTTHCPQGHEYTPDNTWMQPRHSNPAKFSRVCRTCYPTRDHLATLADFIADGRRAA